MVPVGLKPLALASATLIVNAFGPSLLGRSSPAEPPNAYELLKDHFSMSVAGRFPFQQRPGTSEGSEATPADLIRLLDLLEMIEPGDTTGALSSEDQAFLGALHETAPFLSALVDDGESVRGLYVLARFSRSESEGAENIIEWELTTSSGGSIRASVPSDPRFGREVLWQPGDFLDVRFRWAANAPVTPEATSSSGRLSVSGRSASFRFDGIWALLRLIDEHLVSSGEDRGKAVLLAFEVPTIDISTRGEMRTLARLKVRLEVRHPITRDIVAIPQFPSRVPRSPSD